MKKRLNSNAAVKAMLIIAMILALTGCGGRYSMNSTALGIECETRADCMKQLSLPGSESGEPKITVAPYSVNGQYGKAVAGNPALIGGGSFDADADVILMKAIRDIYPNATIIPGGPVGGAVGVTPTKVNVQSTGFGAKCEMEFTAKYEGVQKEYLAKGSGVTWNMSTGMASHCPVMKEEAGKAIREFVDTYYFKTLPAKPKE